MKITLAKYIRAFALYITFFCFCFFEHFKNDWKSRHSPTNQRHPNPDHLLFWIRQQCNWSSSLFRRLWLILKHASNYKLVSLLPFITNNNINAIIATRHDIHAQCNLSIRWKIKYDSKSWLLNKSSQLILLRSMRLFFCSSDISKKNANTLDDLDFVYQWFSLDFV